MLHVASDTGASSASGGSHALAVGGGPSAKRARTVRVPPMHLMPFATDRAVKPTTQHEHALLQVSMQQVMDDNDKLKGAGPISLATERQYMMNVMLNFTLDVTDTTYRWGPTLHGKLDVRGIIEKETIVQLYTSISAKLTQANMSLNSYNTADLGASQPVVRVPVAQAVVAPMGGAAGVVRVPGFIGGAVRPMAIDTGAAATTMMALTNAAGAAHGGGGAAAAPHRHARRKDANDAKKLTVGKVALVRVKQNVYQVYNSTTPLGADGTFTTADVKILSAYVSAMQKRSQEIRRANKKEGPKIVCGSKGKNDIMATHLLSQMEIFFTHYASEGEKDGGSFVP